MLVQTIKSEFKIGSKDLIKSIKKLMDYPIQPLKRTSIMSLFPTRAEIEAQQNNQSEAKAVVSTKPNVIKRSIKYKIDKKNGMKNRFVINDVKPNKDSIFEHKENMYRKFIETQQKLNGMEINTVGNSKNLKYALGRGNNILLVQLAMKNRFWWQKTKRSSNNVNFLWTQLMCRKFISSLDGLNANKELMCESDLDSTAVGSNSQSNLKESASSQDTKNTTTSSLTDSVNRFPSQKLAKATGSSLYSHKKRVGTTKTAKKDPLACDKFKV